MGRFFILGERSAWPSLLGMIILVSSFFFIIFFGFGYGLSALHEAWENSRHFAKAPTVSSSSAEIPSWWRVSTLSVEFLRSSFSPHFARTPSVASQNVGFFLRLKNMVNTCTPAVWNRPLCPFIPKCRLLAVFTLERDNPSSQSVYPFQAWKRHWRNVYYF